MSIDFLIQWLVRFLITKALFSTCFQLPCPTSLQFAISLSPQTCNCKEAITTYGEMGIHVYIHTNSLECAYIRMRECVNISNSVHIILSVYLFIHYISISRLWRGRDGGKNMWCSCVNSDYFILRIISSISWLQYRIMFLAKSAYIVRISVQKILEK